MKCEECRKCMTILWISERKGTYLVTRANKSTVRLAPSFSVHPILQNSTQIAARKALFSNTVV